eukprot:6294827-Prymnesium_polylepis.1
MWHVDMWHAACARACGCPRAGASARVGRRRPLRRRAPSLILGVDEEQPQVARRGARGRATGGGGQRVVFRALA